MAHATLYLTILSITLDAPILSLLLGASAQRQEILEGSNVYFDCNIQVSWPSLCISLSPGQHLATLIKCSKEFAQCKEHFKYKICRILSKLNSRVPSKCIRMGCFNLKLTRSVASRVRALVILFFACH